MNKNIHPSAWALSTLLMLAAGAASAQESTGPSIYGKLYPELTNYSVTGGTPAGTPVSTLVRLGTPTSQKLRAMESSNSYLGFRGAEDLGGGLKAIWQLEGTVGVDDGSATLWNRDTFVGLSGSAGTLKLGGRMDSVYKRLGDYIGFLGVGTGNFVSASNILAQGGFGTSNAEKFNERPINTALYESPIISGVQALVGYSFAENSNRIASQISYGVAYEEGPVYLAIASEVHLGLFGASNNLTALPALSNLTTAGAARPGADSRDMSTRLTAMYTLPTETRLEFNIARTTLDESGGATGRFQSYRHNSWMVGADQRWGRWMFEAVYLVSEKGACALVGGADCRTDGLEAHAINLGASYALSKRTTLFALYSKLHNGHSANFSNASSIATRDVMPGQQVTSAAAGILIRF